MYKTISLYILVLIVLLLSLFGTTIIYAGHGTLTGFTSYGSQDALAGSGWTAINKKWGAGGLMFDGVDDYVRVTNDSTLNFGTTSYSIGFWMKPANPTPTTYYQIISKAGSTGVSLYMMRLQTDGSLWWRANDGTNVMNVISNSKLSDSNWHYIVGVTDRRTNTGSLYIDGKLDSSAAIPSALNISSSYDFSIGGFLNTDNIIYTPYNGILDAVQIYSRVLTPFEILSNYNATKVEFQTRVGDDATPDDGTGNWEIWKGGATETAIDSFDTSGERWTVDSDNNSFSAVNIANGIDVGDGADGDCIINNGTKTLDSTAGSSVCNGSARSTAYAVNFSSTVLTSAGATSITVSATPTGLSAGDEILIINLQGAYTNFGKVGQYETHTISSIATNTLNFTDYPTKYTYDGTTQKIMVQRIPNFGNVTVCGGNTGGGCTAAATVNTTAWNGTKNGVIFFRSTGTVTVNSGGTITATGLGYRGGTQFGGVNQGAQGGESVCGAGGNGGSTTASNGAGGGGSGYISGNAGFGLCGGGGGAYPYRSNQQGLGSRSTGGAGGGGGAHGGGGGAGYGQPGAGRSITLSADGYMTGGSGGVYGTPDLNLIYLGSGGGRGGNAIAAGGGGNGGNGGGALVISANTITNNGSITNNGNAGAALTSCVASEYSGSGGGGSGGSIKLLANTITAGTNTITSSAGGGWGNGCAAGALGAANNPGTNGGSGRIALYYTTSLSGTVSPKAYTQKLTSQIKTEGNNAQQIKTGNLETDPTVMALWHMDETSGTGAYILDSMGTNHGTPTGASVVDGIIGKARNFSGSNQYIATGNNPFNNSSVTNGTIDAWIKTSTTPGGDTHVVSIEGYINLVVNSAGKAQACSDGVCNYATSITSVTDGKWHLLTMTWTPGRTNIFVDGKFEATTPYSNPTVDSTTRPFMIGAHAVGSAYFTGIIDEVRYSYMVRSADEIAEAYRLGRDHKLSRSINTLDLSALNSLNFAVASDQLGSSAELVIGESAYANNEPDANTVGLWHFEEKATTPRSCLALLNAGFTTSGYYTIDPDGDGANPPFIAYCDQTYENGGWTRIAKFGTAYNILASTYTNGFGVATDAEYAHACALFTNLGLTTGLIRANMGSVRDMFKPTSGYTVCQMITESPSTHFQWTFNDTSYGWQTPSYYSAHLMGSATSYPAAIDGRTYLSFIGGGGAQGSCCHNTSVVFGGAADGAAWGRAFDVYFREAQIPAPVRIIDSSGNGNSGVSQHTGSATVQAKFGYGVNFNGTSDQIRLGSIGNYTSEPFTISMWVNPRSLTNSPIIISKGYYSVSGYYMHLASDGAIQFTTNQSGTNQSTTSKIGSVKTNQWQHIVIVRNGSSVRTYVNGKDVTGNAGSHVNPTSSAENFRIGTYLDGAGYFYTGSVDEFRIDNIARTATEIRQAYDIEHRTYPITIDFKAKLDAENLIADVNDKSFTIDETVYGKIKKADNIIPGRTIIVKENVNGTEYLAQGTVSTVNTDTGAVTVLTWDSGATFPSGGYTANATVFKWQQEVMDLTGIRSDDRNAINRYTLRLTNGGSGGTFYIDDLRHSTANLAAGGTIASTAGKRYFQLKAIFSSEDPNVSASLGPATAATKSINSYNATPITPYPTAIIANSECAPAGNECASTSDCCTPNACTTFYRDADTDTYGAGGVIKRCGTTPPSGYVVNNTDCNDTGTNSANVYTAATCYVDGDNDDYGSTTAKSCTNNATCGSATWASGGEGTAAASGNFIANSTDCDDTTNTRYATRTCNYDNDADTYGTSSTASKCKGASCASPVDGDKYNASNSTDCYDSNANAYPGSAYCSATGRGDGSWDYNCNGSGTQCGNTFGHCTYGGATSFHQSNCGWAVWACSNSLVTTSACGVSDYLLGYNYLCDESECPDRCFLGNWYAGGWTQYSTTCN